MTQRGLTVFTTINIIQFISNPLYFIENLLINTIDISAWKFGPKTGKKPRPNRDQTTWDRKFSGTGKDRNRGPVFGPSQFSKFEDREKTG